MDNSKQLKNKGHFSAYSGLLALSVIKELKKDLKTIIFKPFQKLQQIIGENYLVEATQEYCLNGFTHISNGIHKE